MLKIVSSHNIMLDIVAHNFVLFAKKSLFSVLCRGPLMFQDTSIISHATFGSGFSYSQRDISPFPTIATGKMLRTFT